MGNGDSVQDADRYAVLLNTQRQTFRNSGFDMAHEKLQLLPGHSWTSKHGTQVSFGWEKGGSQVD